MTISPDATANREATRSASGVNASRTVWPIRRKYAAIGEGAVDTSILVDYLNALPEARTDLEHYTEKAVGIITWMEVMVGAYADLEAAPRSFLRGFDTVAVDARIAERAVSLRRSHRIKLPDAVIWATAQVHAMLLVTRNTRDFPGDDPGVRTPYRL